MKLARREKYFVGGAASLIVLFLVIMEGIVPFVTEKARLEREIDSMEKYSVLLAGINGGGKSSDERSGNMDRILSSRKKDFSLMSYVNKANKSAGLVKNAKKMNLPEGNEQGDYIEDILEIRLEEITLKQLINYLFLIENPDNFIFVKYINISDSSKEEGYHNVRIKIMTYKKIA